MPVNYCSISSFSLCSLWPAGMTGWLSEDLLACWNKKSLILPQATRRVLNCPQKTSTQDTVQTPGETAKSTTSSDNFKDTSKSCCLQCHPLNEGHHPGFGRQCELCASCVCPCLRIKLMVYKCTVTFLVVCDDCPLPWVMPLCLFHHPVLSPVTPAPEQKVWCKNLRGWFILLVRTGIICVTKTSRNFIMQSFHN